MPYAAFIELVRAWQGSNFTDFASVESFFLTNILPIQDPDRLRFHVEIHRLMKLIKSDLEILKITRSPDKREIYLQKIKER